MRVSVSLLLALLTAVSATGCAPPGGRAGTESAVIPAGTASAATDPTETDPDEKAARPPLRFTGEPKVGWVEGTVLRLPGGETVQLSKKWGYTGIARYAGGYLVTDDRYIEGTVGMQRLDADGTILQEWAGTGSPLVSRDGRVAWVSLVPSEGGETGPTLLHVDDRDGGAERTQRLSRRWMPFLTGWFRGQLVYETWGRAASFLTDFDGPPRAVPRAEDPGVIRADGAYSARQTTEGIEFRHADGQLSNIVRDRGLTRTPPGLAWEDDDHVLTTLTRGGRRAVVRIAMNGRMSLASEWRSVRVPGFAFLR